MGLKTLDKSKVCSIQKRLGRRTHRRFSYPSCRQQYHTLRVLSIVPGRWQYLSEPRLYRRCWKLGRKDVWSNLDSTNSFNSVNSVYPLRCINTKRMHWIGCDIDSTISTFMTVSRWPVRRSVLTPIKSNLA